MIKVDLWGRLGNQMFQYAFATSTAKKLNTFFFIVPTERFELLNYFQLDLLTRLLYRNQIFPKYKKYIDRFLNKNYVEQSGNESEIKLMDNCHYRGFFQSENYFNSVSQNLLRKRFKIHRQLQKLFQDKYSTLFQQNKIVTLHVRRTDYLQHGNEELGGSNLVLPMSYYDTCLAKIPDLESYKVVCISDDIEFVKKYYGHRPNFLFESNEMILDFQLMVHADILIVANSTFSWWAGYLNNKPNPIIFGPKYWLGFKIKREYPKGIMSARFTWVDVVEANTTVQV
jgi:hypothetical protein